ncbi:NADPH-dependent oxidoreductase [Thalassotalea sp. HSM 43]|uniref:NADPH-dependent FMN reductase n=1 Tax=Thalassotalea sp. HSM 43 TaxID=2552945 RepID=UPI0010809EA7|nr:NAD(P)H-dependent oxidoreductase [Thalassotalea sp. HSM 43]QBY04625.1 NADPH-dependent oxidoreductase [Thalassotalea sp. HSM 43]
MSKILAFSGSARDGSFNQQLVSIAACGALSEGSEVTVINLADYDMPIFSEDLQSRYGMPEKALQFKQLIEDHHGMLIASPEYNSACSPLLLNALTWASRATSADEVPLATYQGKFATLMSASPGPQGGIRGLVALRMLLSNLGVTVTAEQITVAKSFEAFAQGKLKDVMRHSEVRSLGVSLHRMLVKICAT